MLTTPLFKPWRPIWDARFPALMLKIDALATLRRTGRQVPPSLVDLGEFVLPSDHLEYVPEQTFTADLVQNNLELFLKACVWPRWILLEELLEYASSIGDLHLSALALRTQIEELDVLRVAASVLSSRKEGRDDDAISDAISTLQRRVLPRTGTKNAEQLEEQSSDKDLAAQRPIPLNQSFDQLSEYVHPNYGSHVLSVRPQSQEATQVLGEAFVAVYEAFFALPWANELWVEATLDPFVTLAGKTIPELRDEKILEEGWDEILQTAAKKFLHQSKRDSDFDIEALWPMEVEAIQALKDASVAPQHWPQAFRTLSGRTRYSYLVMQEQRLAEQAVSLGADFDKKDNEAQLPILISGLCFSINLTDYKVTSMARHAAHLINAQNVLGAALVVRSILEHHAVAVELSSKLSDMWDEAQKKAPNDASINNAFKSAVKQLSRVLAGTSSSAGIPSQWRTLWKDSVKKHYNVLDPIKALHAKHPITLQLYGLLSHIMHGTVATGGDLLGAGGEGWKRGHKKLNAQMTIILSQYCGIEASMERQAEVMVIGPILQRLQESGQGLGESIKSMRILEGQKLKLGRDILGEGTKDSPYSFREGLNYHQAFYVYLKQKGINVANRSVVKLASGIANQVEVRDGGTIYFLTQQFST
jgi:hypothetical protein